MGPSSKHSMVITGLSPVKNLLLKNMSQQPIWLAGYFTTIIMHSTFTETIPHECSELSRWKSWITFDVMKGSCWKIKYQAKPVQIIFGWWSQISWPPMYCSGPKMVCLYKINVEGVTLILSSRLYILKMLDKMSAFKIV